MKSFSVRVPPNIIEKECTYLNSNWKSEPSHTIQKALFYSCIALPPTTTQARESD